MPDNEKTEITDQIYDTLMRNTGMSTHHISFKTENVSNCEVNSKLGLIRFKYNGNEYMLRLTEDEQPF